MADPKNPKAGKGEVRFLGAGSILEIREEDTKPGPKLNERSRKMLEQKYGGKMPPSSGPAEGSKDK